MGTYAGAEQALTDKWAHERITAMAAALDDIDTGLSARVYDYFAPKTAKYPFIIVQCQQPPRDVRGVGISRVMVDTLYVVKAVAQTETWDDLKDIAHVIDLAMTSAEGSAVADGLVFTAVREDQFSLVEVESGTQFRHLGGAYKMQAQG